MKKYTGIVAAVLCAVSLATAQPGKEAMRQLGEIPILASGRIKPLDSFARDAVRSVTGKHSWQGQDPMATVLNWVAKPDSAYFRTMIPVDYEPLRAEINAPLGKRYFSMAELMQNADLRRLADDIQHVQHSGAELTIVQSKAAGLLNNVNMLNAILTGEALTIVRIPIGQWVPITSVLGDSSGMTAGLNLAWTGMLASYQHADWDIFAKSVNVLDRELANLRGEGSVDSRRIHGEWLYERIQPFNVAKMLYVGAFAVVLLYLLINWKSLKYASTTLLYSGFFFHTVGLAARWWISGRAPWSNMYESITTAAWGVMLFSLLPYKGWGAKILTPAAAAVGFGSLLITSHVSLNPAINPLVPALQSIWLNIHVIIILLGYSACTLAMAVGHVWLVRDLVKPNDRASLASVNQVIYKMVQFATLFLVVGIILGSVWANSAWGRYWGWDPKETWALITWFFYLGLVHAKLQGWVKPRGLAVGSLVGFMIMLFTYYGVNFWISGLHSYADGESLKVPTAMVTFVIIELALLAVYYLLISKREGGTGRRAVPAAQTGGSAE